MRSPSRHTRPSIVSGRPSAGQSPPGWPRPRPCRGNRCPGMIRGERRPGPICGPPRKRSGPRADLFFIMPARRYPSRNPDVVAEKPTRSGPCDRICLTFSAGSGCARGPRQSWTKTSWPCCSQYAAIDRRPSGAILLATAARSFAPLIQLEPAGCTRTILMQYKNCRSVFAVKEYTGSGAPAAGTYKIWNPTLISPPASWCVARLFPSIVDRQRPSPA